jgi:hypothetical protein
MTFGRALTRAQGREIIMGMPVPAPAPSVLVLQTSRGPNILVRVLWFLFLGLWLGWIATCVGYVLCLTVIGLPLGLAVLNRLPQIMTLRAPSTALQVSSRGGVTVLGLGTRQRPFLVRAVYFLLIGWWLSFFWLALAWLLAIFWIFGITAAAAFLMFDRLPAVMTLRRR